MSDTLLTCEPAKGMRDILPAEAALREQLQRAIVDNYRSWGYQRIETPVLERIEVLQDSKGGDNEKMLFKVLKRGARLARAAGEIADLGLRYDLTVPLTRFFAAHANQLPMPFKALQIGPVFRAERPQRGRYRQFMQCDLDVIGMGAPFAELELVTATAHCLATLGLRDFKVRLNDKRLLVAICLRAGYAAENVAQVLAVLDKSDKIGMQTVLQQLAPAGAEKAARLAELIALARGTPTAAEFVSSAALDLAPEVAAQLDFVAEVASLPDANWNAVFDATLVRGLDYYTGMVFEIGHASYPFSFGGGGRYDGMIGRFLARAMPACGFSIGFERLVVALSDIQQQAVAPGAGIALLADSPRAAVCAQQLAAGWRATGQTVNVLQTPHKRQARFIDELYAAGYARVACVADDGSLTEKVAQ